MMGAVRTIRDHAPALRRVGIALAAAHLLVAAWAWWRTLGRGAGQPDVVGAAYALMLSALAASLAVTWPVAARHGMRSIAVWVSAAALALPIDAWLAMRSAERRDRYETALSSGLSESPDGAFRWSITLAEPFSAGHHALLELERDGRPATLPIVLRRSPRDSVVAGAWGLALRPLGGDRYWLTVGTAWVRGGPQHFLIEWNGAAPQVQEVARGLSVVDGRARWDCAAWGPEAHEIPEAEAFCRLDGTLPPVRSCQLERLAAGCGPEVAPAAGCQPELAGIVPSVVACLERRAQDGDPLAWDALVLATTEARDSRALYDLLARSLAAEQALDPTCAQLRDGARLLVAGRRLGRWWEWVRFDGASRLLTARGAPGADEARCAALPPIAAALACDGPGLAWEAVQTARESGRGEDSCARVLAMAARGEIERLAPPERETARSWRAACAAREEARRVSAR
jgi:hypothetical protein